MHARLDGLFLVRRLSVLLGPLLPGRLGLVIGSPLLALALRLACCLLGRCIFGLGVGSSSVLALIAIALLSGQEARQL